MYTTFETTRAVPVRVKGFAYGVALAVPQFIGRGVFLAMEPEPRGDDDVQRERWEDDGGPCLPDEL